MKQLSTIFLFALTICSFATAQEYKFERDIIQVKCDGKIDNFIVNLTSFVDPKTMKIITSKVDLSYKVQVWTSEQNTNFQLKQKIKGSYVGVEASVDGNKAKYQIDLPDWGLGYSQNTTSFTTKVILKAGLVDGNLNVDCQAGLEKAMFDTQYNVQY